MDPRLRWLLLALLAAPAPAMPTATAQEACSEPCGPSDDCAWDPDACRTNGNLGCEPGALQQGNRCQPPPICEARYANPDAACARPLCPIGVEAPTCTPYQDPSPPTCPDEQANWRTAAGTLACVPSAPPEPTCQDLGGNPDEPGCGLSEADAGRPTLEGWVQDQCSAADNTIALRWSALQGQTYRVERRTAGGWTQLARLDGEARSYDHQPGDMQRDTDYEYRVVHEAPDGQAASEPVVLRLLPCPAARPASAESPQQACPPHLRLHFEQPPESLASRNLRRFFLYRYDETASSNEGVLVAANHPLVQRGSPSSLDDYGIHPSHTYRYTILTDYGGRGAVYTPLAVQATASTGCPSPSLAIESQDATALTLAWTWLPYRPAMDWYVQDIRLERIARPDPAPTGPDAPRVAAVAHVLPARDSAPSRIADANVVGNLSYEYRLAIDTVEDALTSPAQAGKTQGPPWPVPWLNVQTRPTAERPDTYYPPDLTQNASRYGVVELQWTAPNDGGAALEAYRLRWRQLEFQADCSIPAANANVRLVLPAAFHQLSCRTEGPVPDRLSADRGPAMLVLQASNRHGPSIPVTVGAILPWRLVEGPTQAALNDSLAALRRTDLVEEANLTLETLPWIPDGHVTALRPMQGPVEAAEPPRQAHLHGQPCGMPARLALALQRIEDHHSVGVPVALEPFPRLIPTAAVELDAWDLSFTTTARLHDHASGQAVLPGPLARVLSGGWEGRLEPLPIDAPRTWQLDGWSQAFSQIPPAEAELPFNAVGHYCWIDGLLATAEQLEDDVPPAVALSPIGPTRLDFRHDVQGVGTTDLDVYRHGAAQGPACLCTTRTLTRLAMQHAVQQALLANASHPVELESRGTEAPLASSASLGWGDPDAAELLLGALARHEALLDTRLDPGLLAELQQRNRQLAVQQRWDRQDTPPADLAPGNRSASPYVLQPWLDVRPDLGVRDADGNWYAPANFTPVAYVGGIIPWRSDAESAGRTWAFEHQWFRMEDAGWVEQPSRPDRPYPDPDAASSAADYDQRRGVERWMVNVSTTLRDEAGRTLTRLNLSAQAQVRIDRLTIPGTPSSDLGIPVIKRDVDPLGHPMDRAWWQPSPESEAPWERPEPGRATWVQGRPLADGGRLDTLLRAPDPAPTPTSGEEPWPKDRDTDLQAFRANDSFLAFHHRGSQPEAIWPLAFIKDATPYDTETRAPLPPNRRPPAFTVADGDTLQYRLFVRPTTVTGEVKTLQAGAGDDAALVERTRINFVAIYADGNVTPTTAHPEAVNRWVQVRQGLEKGRQLVAIAVHALAYTDDVDHPDQALQVFYLDEVVLESPSRSLRYPIYTSAARAGLQLWDQQAVPGQEARYVSELAFGQPLQEAPGLDLDPANPFIAIRRLPAVAAGLPPSLLSQPLAVQGLMLVPQGASRASPPQPTLPDVPHYALRVKVAPSIEWPSERLAVPVMQPAYTYLELVRRDPDPSVEEHAHGLHPQPGGFGLRLEGSWGAQTIRPGALGTGAALSAAPFTALGQSLPMELRATTAYNLTIESRAGTDPGLVDWREEARRDGKTWIRVTPLESHLHACVDAPDQSVPIHRYRAPRDGNETAQVRFLVAHGPRTPEGEGSCEPGAAQEDSGWPEAGRILIWYRETSDVLHPPRQAALAIHNSTATVVLPARAIRSLDAYYDSPSYWHASAALDARADGVDRPSQGGAPGAFALGTLAVVAFGCLALRGAHRRRRAAR